MAYQLKIENTYMGIPVCAGSPEEILEIFCGEEKIYEFRVPVCKESGKYDYYSYLNVKEYQGKELCLSGNFEESFWNQICQSESASYEKEKRPLLHFTAQRGWINDPNGMVYHNGKYHLYFQYNPMNTEWQNMSWGHAVSEDLLQFQQMENVMYPDEHGAMFSGCGLVNERGLLGLPKEALLFYYSAAGDTNEWSKGKDFTQRIAYSLDEGNTLVKMPQEAVGVIQHDTRDPKVFWHEESNAYIMVLWIQGNEFGFFRSTDLQNWEQTDSIVLEKAWECPDLFQLDCEGEKIWVFTSADGFYYLGDFDGYHFTTDGKRNLAYLTHPPYAAQTFSGVEGRVIHIPWLRTRNEGKLFTGMMGIPRELELVKVGAEKVLSLLPVREYEASKKQIASFACSGEELKLAVPEPAVIEVELWPQETKEAEITVFGEKIIWKDQTICYKEETVVLPEAIKEMHILVDREMIEIYINEGTRNLYFATDSDEIQGSIHIKGCSGDGKIYTWQP